MADPTRWQLTASAADDLDAIFDYTVERWSLAQAERYLADLRNAFDLLAEFPALARERTEFSPPARFYTVASHLVVYRTAEPGIQIVRVLHARQNWYAAFN